MNPEKQTTYIFRPYELIKVDYKCYKGLFDKGINTYPKPRSGHRIVCNDSFIYSFGGFNPNLLNTRTNNRTNRRTDYLFQELWKFNLFTHKWSICGPIEGMPDELASNAAILKNNLLIVFGGTGFPFGENCSNKCYLFQPSQLQKSIEALKTTGDEPPPQYGQSIVLKNNDLYVIGGTTGFDYSCDIYRLNLITKVWKCISICREDIREDPKGRYRHEVVHDDNYIYVLGGGTAQTAFSLKEIPAFSIELEKWEHIKTKPDPLAKPGYPGPRKCHSCVQYDTEDGIEVIIAGGYHENLTFFDDIWKLNLTTFKWTLFQEATIPNKIYFHDAATSGNGLMHVFGGIELRNGQNERTNDIYKIWVKIPKLSEICWDAVLHYNPRLPLHSKPELLEMGIPNKFASRIHIDNEKTS